MTPQEREAFHQKAQSAGLSLTDLIKRRLGQEPGWFLPEDRELQKALERLREMLPISEEELIRLVVLRAAQRLKDHGDLLGLTDGLKETASVRPKKR